jgi:AraC-like DNA-binding protein
MKGPRSKLLASRAFEASGPGAVRVGPILALPSVLAELGVRPRRAFARAGVDPELFKDPDGRIQFEDLGTLLETCVALTGCPHFGLLVGARFDMQGFGPLGYLMRNSATVGEAVRSLLLHLHLHDRGAAPVLLAPERSCVFLGYSIYRARSPAAGHTQIYDAAVAIGYRILGDLCGPTWKALRVDFSHRRPRSIAPYRRVFRSNVSFDAELSGIVFASSWLNRAIEGADATLHDLLAKAIRDAEADDPMSFADQVRAVLHQLLLSGTASAEAVALLFALPERTLRRRLAEEGTSLQKLINQTRFELAQQLLQNTGLGVSAIAAALQYADSNAFSRAFRNWANLSPSQWRTRR